MLTSTLITNDSIVIKVTPDHWATGWNVTSVFTGFQIVGEVAAGGEPVIPEPVGLGLVGLALLAVRKRRS